jgi:hypothetical protein
MGLGPAVNYQKSSGASLQARGNLGATLNILNFSERYLIYSEKST